MNNFVVEVDVSDLFKGVKFFGKPAAKPASKPTQPVKKASAPTNPCGFKRDADCPSHKK